ncbi:hypothetical protein ATANTOWER_028587, partial [Ataeniobius toweri]|nr:hypothetical protein [Ataeniobius toweri]
QRWVVIQYPKLWTSIGALVNLSSESRNGLSQLQTYQDMAVHLSSLVRQGEYYRLRWENLFIGQLVGHQIKPGLHGYMATTKPLLKDHMKFCLTFDTSYVRDTANMWQRMHWSDELGTFWSTYKSLCLAEN